MQTKALRRSSAQFIGETHGRLLILSARVRPDHRTEFFVRCGCGTEKFVLRQSVVAGTTVSCGCYWNDHKRDSRNATHGRSKTKTYAIWAGMKKRCENERTKAYPRYGGRGLRVCDRWQRFPNFLADMGEAPDGMSIERIDNARGYEPGNCRWATDQEQARNRRNVRQYLVNGVPMCLPDAAKALGIKYATAYYRANVSGTLMLAKKAAQAVTVESLTWD